MKEAINQSKNDVKNEKKNPENQIPSSNIQNKPLQQPKNVPNNRNNFGLREEDIKKLTDLSFSREAAIRALRATNGDPEKAAALLFSESGNFF